MNVLLTVPHTLLSEGSWGWGELRRIYTGVDLMAVK